MTTSPPSGTARTGRLTPEREAQIRENVDELLNDFADAEAEVDASRAEITRLREALTKIAYGVNEEADYLHEIARAALTEGEE